jgi:hypothetical protein
MCPLALRTWLDLAGACLFAGGWDAPRKPTHESADRRGGAQGAGISTEARSIDPLPMVHPIA